MPAGPVVYPTSATTPLGDNTTFICSIVLTENSTFADLSWEVDELRFHPSFQEEQLHGRGIFQSGVIEDGNKFMSTLVAAGIEMNNGSVVRCQIGTRDRMGAAITSVSNMSVLTVYGPPASPTNVSASELGLLQLNVSWTAVPTLPDVSVTYRINVTNLDTLEVLVSDEVTSTSFVFEGTEPSCDTYELSVTAANGAGESSPSDVVNATLPTCKLRYHGTWQIHYNFIFSITPYSTNSASE